MRAFVAACLLAVAAADQKIAASTSGYGPAPTAGGRAYSQPPRGAPGAGAGQPGGRPQFGVSPGGFKTPAGTGFQPEFAYEPSPYAFDYSVNNYDTGALYSANENHDGKQTTGFYKVALPDGRTQTVKYTVDDLGGFNAEVSYEGEARFPDPSEYTVQQAAGGFRAAPIGYKSIEKAPAGYKPPAFHQAPLYQKSAAAYKTDAAAAAP